MGFLSGVLDAVKDDEHFKTYVLNGCDIIQLINKKIGNGRSDFNLVISSVNSVLFLWDKMLTARTKNVLAELGRFKNEAIVNCCKNIDKVQGKGCMEIHTSSMQSAVYLKAFITQIRQNEEGFNGLDSILKDKLKIPLDKIEEKIQMLKDSGKNQALINAVRTVQSTFDELPGDVELFISENVKSAISGHQDIVKKIKEVVRSTIDGIRATYITQCLKVTKEDLMKAVTTFRKNAYNLGGLNNAVIKKAIETLENRLKSINKDKDPVEDDTVLGDLNTVTVRPQCENIRNELNEACAEKHGLDTLETWIGQPDVIFTKHKQDLEKLVDDAKKSLQQALKCAEENAKNLGGLRNSVVANAINVLQKRLQTADTGKKKIESLADLKDLANQPIYEEISKIKRENNLKGVTVSVHVTSLQGNIESPDATLRRIHQPELIQSGLKVQEAVINAINNATTHIKSSSSSVHEKIVGEFKSILESFKGNKKAVSHLKSQVGEAVEKIKKLDSIFNAKNENVKPALKLLTTLNKDIVENNFIRSFGSHVNITELEFCGWMHSYFGFALKDLNEVIAKSDQAYTAVSLQLEFITSAARTISDKAEKDQLNVFTAGIDNSFVLIKGSINSDSVYEADRIARTKYFEDLKSQITKIVAALSETYKNAYRSAAKSYLNGAIGKIKAAVGDAERQYVDAVTGLIKSIDRKVSQLDHKKFTKQMLREELKTFVNTEFTDLLAAVDKNSAFIADAESRKASFEQVQKLIKDTMQNLSTAYKEAYQCSAKTYLSNAIKEIKDKVGKAEEAYQKAVENEAMEIKNILNFINESMFKDRGQSKKRVLEKLFETPFQQLQAAVLANTAFQKDDEARKTCFCKLHALIIDTIITLVDAADAFDTCATKAVDYLRQSFDDAQSRVDKLGINVKDEVKRAFNRVTAEVYDMFAKDKIAQLGALKDLVEVQKNEVERIIGVDLKKGVKGLLQLLKMWLDKKSGDLKNAQDLKSLADLFKHLNKHLHRYVKFQHDGLEVEDDSDDDRDDDSLSSTPAVRPVPPPISGGGYRARPAVQSASSKDPNAPQPAGRAGYLGKVRTPSTGQQFVSPQLTKDPISDCFDRIDHHTRGLFGTLSAGYFSKSLASKREEFVQFLDSIRPYKFGGHCDTLLYILMSCLQSFLKELGKAYVSTYCGAAYMYDWGLNVRNCAKVFLTILNTLCEDLPYLENKCKDNSKYSWKHKTISEKHDNKENALGCYLKRCGYAVAKDEHSKDGELNFPYRNYKGGNIYLKLNETKYTTDEHTKHLKSCESNLDEEGKPKTEDNFTLFNILDCLLHHLEKYNEVCHIYTLYSKARPCSAYEMLVWLSGLPHNPVYHDVLHDGIGSVLEEPKNSVAVVDGIPLLGQESSSLAAYPNDITWNSMKNAVEHLCAKAYDVLIGILGTGNELTIYGSDFSNNSFKFHYPASGEDCLDMLLDVLRRLFPVFRFIENQCRLTSQHYGWADCYYGKDVYPSDWQCKKHDAERADCMPRSALMSYLTDSLPGHLPHRLKKIGCKFECNTCPGNRPGMPCLTPLGFRDFSGRKRTGKELSNVLTKFFGDVNLSRLLCLTPKPPATLPEHFGFALSLEQGLSAPKSRNLETYKSFADTMDKSIKDVSIMLYEHAERLTTPLRNAYGCTQNGNPSSDVKHADLSSLSTANTSATAHCAPYLKSMCHDSYHYFSHKNSKLYLSWAIYSPWALHNYLVGLRDALKDIFCHDWRCTTCLHGDKCKRGEHGILHDSCKCDSVVSCRGVLPTLYKYGFAFADARELIKTKKTCFAICTQLQNVIKSTYFTDLFDTCDKFLFKIRAPFIWLNVALWSLSLFYLICVMVGRLDVLHIKSHLRSPSSHKITAQSLLAAAQVGRLAKISYLQP